MLVKFIARYDIYMHGEVAGFPEDTCARLIAAHVAVPEVEQTAVAPRAEVAVVSDQVSTVPQQIAARRRRSK